MIIILHTFINPTLISLIIYHKMNADIIID